jgi:hypothetical protein
MTLVALISTTILGMPGHARAEPLEAGVARVDITHPEATRVNDPCFARALVLSEGATSVALVTVDAVAIGGIVYELVAASSFGAQFGKATGYAVVYGIEIVLLLAALVAMLPLLRRREGDFLRRQPALT